MALWMFGRETGTGETGVLLKHSKNWEEVSGADVVLL